MFKIMDTQYIRLYAWIFKCVDAWSPWLFVKTDVYTVVDHVDVVFDPDVPLERVTYMKNLLGCDRYNCMLIDTNRYKMWENECGYKFLFEQLVLHITTKMAYFIDTKGRQSRFTFFLEDGPRFETATEGNQVIPWLLQI